MERDATPPADRQQGERSGAPAPRAASLVRVASPDGRGETAGVVRAAMAVTVVALLWIGRTHGSSGAGGGALEQPWQVAFAALDGAAQRHVRALHEATLELLRAREESGGWPTVEALAADGIEPFASAVARTSPLEFRRLQRGGAWQYLGVARAGATAHAQLIQLLEPQPGDLEGRDPRQPLAFDEQHRRLRDGTLLHVSFWIAPPERAVAGGEFLADPALHGFRQVLSGLAPGAKPRASEEIPR